MRKFVVAFVLSLVLLSPCYADKPDHTLYAVTQDGTKFVLKEEKEDNWLREAQAIANRRKEAIAVTQQGKLVCLLNPMKK